MSPVLLEKAKGRRCITVESDPNMCAAMMRRQCLVIRSAMRRTASKDVLGSYAHCTETSEEFGTNCSAAIMHKLQFAANQRCSQVPCRPSKLPGLHLAKFPGSTAHTPSPHGHGCDVIDGHIFIHLDQQPAPNRLLQYHQLQPQTHC